MNTSRKGASYERAFRHLLEKSPYVDFVIRSAASKGPFDLVLFAKNFVIAYQLKAGRTSCNSAFSLSDSLRRLYEGPYEIRVVHRTDGEEFCTH